MECVFCQRPAAFSLPICSQCGDRIVHESHLNERVSGTSLAGQDATSRSHLRWLTESNVMAARDLATVLERSVRLIAERFSVRVVCISQLQNDDLFFRAIYTDGNVRTNFGSAPLSVEPCATVARTKGLQIYDRAAERFPHDKFLRQYQADSYCGFPVVGYDGTVIAIGYLLDDKPRSFTEEDQQLLKLIGQWLATRFEEDRLSSENAIINQSLRDINERLGLATSTCCQAMWDLDPKTEHATYTQDYASMLGYDLSELNGSFEEFRRLLHPDDRDRVFASQLAYLQGESSNYQTEFRLRTKSGDWKWVQSTGRIVKRDAFGHPERMIGLHQDLDVLKLAEESSQVAEERLELIVNSVKEYAAFTLDPDGKVLSWNAGAERNKGYKDFEIVGQHFSIFYTQDDIARKKPDCDLQTTVKEGHFQEEGRRVRKDGSVFWANVTISPIYGKFGKLRGFSKVTGDITERKRAAEALRASEERFRLVVESIPTALLLIDAYGRIQMANARSEEWFGYRPNELIGQTVDLLVPESKREQHIKYRRDFLTKPQTRAMGAGRDLHGVRKDGTEFPVEIGLVPIQTETGIMVLTTIVDITDRKLFEAALRESEERLRLSLVASGQGFFDLDIESGRAVVSSEYAKMLGYDPATFEEPLSSWIERLHPEDKTVAVSTYQKYVRGEIPEYRQEFRLRTRDSRWLWILSIGSIVSRDTDGKPLRMLGTHASIQERKEIEIALRASESRLNEAQCLAKIGSWELDLQTSKLTWSDEVFRIFEMDSDQFGASIEAFLDAIHPDDREMVNKAYTTSVSSRTPYEIVHRLKMVDGRIKYVHERCCTYYSPEGQPLRSLGTVQDITDQKLNEERVNDLQNSLAHSNRLQTFGEIASGLAHELNQPLGAIHLSADAAQFLAQRYEIPELRESLKQIGEQSFRAGEIIRRMRSFIRHEQPQRKNNDINRLVREVLALMSDYLRQQAVNVETGFGESLPAVDVDAIQIQQVMVNLIRNAVDAMASITDRTRVVAIRTEWMTNLIQIAVTDTGCGISPAIAEKLFFPLQTNKPTGMGLGLSICRTIVEAHGGQIGYQSDPDQKTTFYFTLPVTT